MKMRPLIVLDNVWLEYPGKKGAAPTTILQNINLQIEENDIVSLLCPSGCGKSTLIRLVAGLIKPTRGAVRFHDKDLEGICPGVAMVFQNFALFPWLTVSGNVRLPLKQMKLFEEEVASRTSRSLEIGLTGYESEEAVYLAKRIVVFAARQGRVAVDISNPLPYPRVPSSPEFLAIVSRIQAVLTHQELPEPALERAVSATTIHPIPRVNVNEIIGLTNVVSTQPRNIFDLGNDPSFRSSWLSSRAQNCSNW